jgi:hypothetical protein
MQHVLDALDAVAWSRMAGLVKATGHSKESVRAALQRLVREGFVEVQAADESHYGRPRREWRRVRCDEPASAECAKRDGTERRIIQALRKVGVQVFPISGEGRGLPDLLLFHRGRWSVLEVKASKKSRLTDAQLNTRVTAPFPVVCTVEEALALFQVGA